MGTRKRSRRARKLKLLRFWSILLTVALLTTTILPSLMINVKAADEGEAKEEVVEIIVEDPEEGSDDVIVADPPKEDKEDKEEITVVDDEDEKIVDKLDLDTESGVKPKIAVTPTSIEINPTNEVVEKMVTITFVNATGGGAPAPITAPAGSYVLLPEFDQSGSHVANAYTNIRLNGTMNCFSILLEEAAKAGATVFYTNQYFKVPENDITLYASKVKDLITKDQVMVNFIHTAGGTLQGQPLWPVLRGATWSKAGIKVPTPHPDEGYTFIGWEKSDLAAPHPESPDISYIINGNITYTAKFEAKTYTVNFFLDGVLIDTQLVKHGEGAKAPEVKVKRGYTLTDWDAPFDVIKEDTNVYRSNAIRTYTVKFYVDGELEKSQIVEHGKGAYAPEVEAKESHTLTEWSTSFDVIKKDTNVYRTNVINQYAVRFYVDGELVDTQMVKHGDDAKSPEVKDTDTKTFAGWDKDFDKITKDTDVFGFMTDKEVDSDGPEPDDPEPDDPGPDDPGPVDPGPVDPTEPVVPIDPTDPVLPTVPDDDPVPPVIPVTPVTPFAPVIPFLPGPVAPIPELIVEVDPAIPTPTEPTGPEEIADTAVPTAGLADGAVPLAHRRGSGEWALLNLILTLLTAVGTAVLWILYFVNKRKEDSEDGEEITGVAYARDQEEQELKRHGIWRIMSVVPAITAIIVFILTEDMRLRMVWIDRWTIIMAIIALVQVIIMILAKKKVKGHQPDDADEVPVKATK